MSDPGQLRYHTRTVEKLAKYLQYSHDIPWGEHGLGELYIPGQEGLPTDSGSRPESTDSSRAQVIALDYEKRELIIQVTLPPADTDVLRLWLSTMDSQTIVASDRVAPDVRVVHATDLGKIMNSSTAQKSTLRAIGIKMLRTSRFAAGAGVVFTIVASVIKSNVLIAYPILPALLLVGFSFAYFGASVALKEP